jgi:hypothetical protein
MGEQLELGHSEIRRRPLAPAKRARRTPTGEQFEAYRGMFDYFNGALFDGKLPQPLLTVSRGHARVMAHYKHQAWKKAKGKGKAADEISLSPIALTAEPFEVASSLVHEMCHEWQHHFGDASRPGYHNVEWCAKMRSVGLIPLDPRTGKEINAGQSASDKPDPAGVFLRLYSKMPKKYLLPWLPAEGPRSAPTSSPGTGEDDDEDGDATPPAPPKSKIKYTCPKCHANVWGKPGLKLACIGCVKPFEELS